ncbi:MAG: AAA family ATPase [Eubacteriales bacterium]|nr:AAA family ATPase [Eubacteriales bacterium]
MERRVSIGHQDFETVRMNQYFYIDKTSLIKEWWENGDGVTLITRPRRFGKTLNMSMVEKFFSIKYRNRDDLFEGLSVWQDEKYRELQGTYPVISLSFANIKEINYETAHQKILQLLVNLYVENYFLRCSDVLTEKDRVFFDRVSVDMGDSDATLAIYQLSEFLHRYYGKRVIILLDEYDTPMQEAYVNGYWEELTAFFRGLFNAAFKTNPYLERAILTGITRISRESIFSDLNNLKIVTTTSREYADCFGFTEAEVFGALEEYGMSDEKEHVKRWYDGFTFGDMKDIYNPWSIINYLDTGELSAYWANTSSNSLIGKLIQEGSNDLKIDFEDLMQGKSVQKIIDEQVTFSELSEDESAVWSLLVASGYLKIDRHYFDSFSGERVYELSLTNMEVRLMFKKMIRGWFSKKGSEYNPFIRALLKHDLKSMNAYMNSVALATISYFDSGTKPSREEPERFYHGFVLGLIVELAGRYTVTSNRESGFGRYDIVLEPLQKEEDAMIIEFKVFDPDEEKSLQDTVQKALKQINDKDYAASLIARGIQEEHIRKYGFAFEGKRALIGMG